MATLLKCNAVFLHVPKTGGMFLRKVFAELDLIKFDFSRDHSDMERTLHVSEHYPGNFYLRSFQLRKNIEKQVSGAYKFCFVRHPFSWYESYWAFMCDHQWRSLAPERTRTRFGFKYDQWYPTEAVEKCGDKDFNKFIENVIQMAPGYLTNMYGLYTDANCINFVGKQENLLQDAKQILKDLNIKYDEKVLTSLGKLNESKTKKPIWNSDNKKAIYELEKSTFKKYGYTFDEI